MIEAELPDGTILEFPEGTSQDVVQRVVKQRLKIPSTPPLEVAPQKSGFLQELGNLGAGALRGAGSIGATLLTPYDLLAGNTKSIANPERRKAMDEGLASMGADTESLAFKGGKIGAEILGTMGVPGALARGATASGSAPAIVNALRSGGMVSPGLKTAAGNAALRLAGGAAVGGAAAGLVNPEDMTTGAAIGAALPGAQAVLRGAGQLASKVLGTTTGAGDQALSQAYKAGKAGGAESKAFRENMRGQADMLDVLNDAKANLGQLKAQRSAQYQAGTAGMRASTQPMDLRPIFKSIDDVSNDFMFQGQARNPKAAEAIQEARGLVDNWANLDPNKYHTPEGVDALKQQISALRERMPFDQKSARVAVDKIRRAVDSQIKQADPKYAEAMADYSKASDLIERVEQGLSLNEKASADTALRKLQSLMRNNVNTNYGQRLAGAQALESQGGRPIMPALAGQALNSFTPRALQGMTATGLGGGFIAMGNPLAAGLTISSSSPRAMGEVFYGAGRLAGGVNPELVNALRRGVIAGAPVLGAQ